MGTQTPVLFKLWTMREMPVTSIILWITLFWITTSAATGFRDAKDFDKPAPVTQVQGVFGRKVALPCDVTPSVEGDVVLMVLWFLEPSQQPLYSLDARGVRLDAGRRWSSPDLMEGRAFFRTASRPAALLLDGVRVRDEALYRCRVDFRDSPTRHRHVNLTVIVPPGRPRIYDGRNNNRSRMVAPYVEGSDVVLICEVDGGRPTPRLSWFMESTLLDESWLPRPAAVGGGSINRLLMPGVGRQHQHARLVCQATNTDMVAAATTAVILDVQLRPIEVHILNKESQLVAGRSLLIECKASGSSPPAVITWWKSGIELVGEQHMEESKGFLHFMPKIEDHGHYLSCRAENPVIADSILEDMWLLNVLYPPVISLNILGAPKSGEYAEGDQAVLQCNVKANPSIWKLMWYHNGIEIQRDEATGVLMEGIDLVLSNISSITSGQYKCIAQNAEGQTESEAVAIIVRFSPVCNTSGVQTVAVPVTLPVSLKCSVEANPQTNITFRWTSLGTGDVPSRLFNSTETTSTLTYKPGVDLGYGSLACLARNEAGEGRQPCLYDVVPPGPPQSPTNCRLDDPGTLRCQPGFDGGLPQHYLAQVLPATDSLNAILNISSSEEPIFRVPGLFSYDDELVSGAVEAQVLIIAENDRGRSQPVFVKDLVYTEKKLYRGGFASFTAMAIDPLVFALLICAAVSVTLGCALCFLMRRRCCHLAATDKEIAIGKRSRSQNSRTQDASFSSVYDEGIDDPDPDLIPSKEDSYTGTVLLTNSSNQIAIVKKSPVRYSCGNLSNYGKVRCTTDQAGSLRSLGRVSRGVTAAWPDQRGSTLPRREIITKSPAVRESCI